MYEKLSTGNLKFMELDQPVQVLFIFFQYVRGAHNVERAERESLRSTKNEENNVLDEDLIIIQFLGFSSSHYHIFVTFSLTSLRNGVSSLNQYESASDKPKFILSP